MSSASAAASDSSTSASNGPDSAPSNSANSTGTPPGSSSNGTPTSPSTTTSGPSSQQPATSSPPGSPANHSASQARDLDQTTQGTFGQLSGRRSPPHDHATSSSKTSPESRHGTPRRAPETLAYVAGVIDGEGCVYIEKSRTLARAPRVDVGMSKAGLEVLRLLHSFGGTVRTSRQATETWAAAFMWTVTGSEASQFLSMVLPYLRLKRQQAELALRCQEIRESLVPDGGRRANWTEEAAARCDTLRQRIQDLNRKGPRDEEPVGDAFALLAGGEWVVPQLSLFADLGSEKFSGTWPQSGSMRNGRVSMRPTSAPLTDDADGGASLLPTPTASEYGMQTAVSSGKRGQPRPSLGHMARHDLWPTPTASDGKGGPGSSGRDGGDNLRTAVAQTAGGPLNADWVEWLIGSPIGWTDSAVSATVLSRNAPSLSACDSGNSTRCTDDA
jgi:hypothetical protein